MKDWKQRVELLVEKGLSIQIEKDGEIIFESAEPMLRPLYHCITEKLELMKGAVVVDKIVGRAAALLCVLGKVSEVYTPLASETAVALLTKNGIRIEAKKVISQIMNRDNSGPCPMEKMASAFESPVEFYNKLKEIYSVK
jgi:hypothetical protein